MRLLLLTAGVSIGVAVACGQSTSSSQLADADAGTPVADGGFKCGPSNATPDWLETYLPDRLAKLATQPDRATPEHRKEAREYLKDELVGLGLDAIIDEYGDGANVVAHLPATSGATREWVLVGAHYDSVPGSAGANDNASGTVAALAVARAASELACRHRGLIVAFFDQEEVGLVGSKALAAKEVGTGTKIMAVHTVDQVGWDADGDRRIELELPTSDLLAAYQASAETLGLSVVKTSTDTSDHQSFREKGFPAVGITEEYVNRDTSPHAHQRTDTPGTVNPAYHTLATKLVADVVAKQLTSEE